MKINPFAKPLLAVVLGGLGLFSVAFALTWPVSQPTDEVPNGKIGDWGYDLRTLMAPDDIDAPITGIGVGNVSATIDGRYKATISDGSVGGPAGGQALVFDIEGPLGAEFYCDEDGENCVTASALATAVAGGSTATAVQAVSDAPGSPNAGDVYYDTDDNIPYVWNGTAWTPFFDGMGNHTATTTLDINTQNIDGANFEVTGASGNTVIGGTLDIAGATQLGLDGTDGSLVIYSEDVGGDFTYTIQPGVAADNVVLTLPVDDGTVDQVLRTDGSGVLSWVTQTSGADNLGDHTATTTLTLGSNDLTGTTGDINFANFDVSGASGNTVIGGTLDIVGSTQFGLDGTDGSLVIYSDDVGGDFTYTIQPGVATDNVVLTLPVDDGTPSQVLQTDGSGVLSWVTQSSGADNLGNHTATTTLDINTQNIDGANFDVSGASGNTVIGGTLGVAGVTQFGLDGADGSLVIYSDDVGGDFTYTIQPGVATDNVVLTLPVDDGTPSQVLQTDGSGVLSWVTQSSGADNLGDHTATTTIDLNTQLIDGNNFDVNGDTGNTVIGGTLNAGATTLTSTLDVTGATGIDGNFDVGGTDFTVEAATGNTVIAGTLGVTGATTLSSTLAVTGGITGASIELGGGGTTVTSISNATDLGAGSASDSNLATQLAIKTYVDAQAGADDLGNHTATTNIILSDQYISNDGGNEGIRVDDSGNVGIMTVPSGTYELEVNGDLYTENVYGTSDERLKKNIKPLTGALDKIAQMQGVSYRWKDTAKGDTTYLGVIAQEAELIYPQIVQTATNGYKAVSYGSVVAPLIEAVKELKARNEALDERVAELETLLGQ